MAKRNFKKLLDDARNKALKGERISIPGKIVEYSPEEIQKDPYGSLSTTIDISINPANIDNYYDALGHALERGDQTKLHELLENEVEMPKAFYPILAKALLTPSPPGESVKLTLDEKIRICYQMNLSAVRESKSHAKIFSDTAEKYSVDIRTIERWWDEVNEAIAPTPGVKTLLRRAKKAKA